MTSSSTTPARHRRARTPGIRIGLALLIALTASLAVTASASARSATKVVSYHGYRVRVPVAWPVYRLAVDPTTCVRFDRHAVYLGAPGSSQLCPPVAIGRTEAILVTPLSAHAARAGASGGAALPGVTVPGAQRDGGSSLELRDSSRAVLVTATWGRHPNLIRAALGVRSLKTAVAAGSAARARSARAHPASSSGAPFHGLGFDACSAPSVASMSAWAASYAATGIYIGGTNMACSQPNLSASWTSTESAAGWHLIPTYVGLQAPTSSCGCATIAPKQASGEGAAAAADAVNLAAGYGLGPGSPIYFDMEAYTTTQASTTAVLTFLGAWTSTLHADGYLSGVYSSAASGIRDLADAAGTSFVEPDDVWIASWNGQRSTSDPNVPSDQWANHQRLHQYAGGHNETHGGVTIDVDSDYLDGATATNGGSGGSLPDGTFVQVAGTSAFYRIAGGAPLYITDWSGFGGPQPVTVITPQQLAALRPTPASGTFLATTSGAMYRVAGGAPLLISNPSLFGPSPPTVTVDVWDIQNVSNPLAHLLARPADGTVVEGLPSHRFWRFKSGTRGSIRPIHGAVPVDERSLSSYPVRPAPACVVPRLSHMGINAARSALRRARCRLGKVHRPRHVSRTHFLRVVRQSPRPRTVRRLNSAVDITVR